MHRRKPKTVTIVLDDLENLPPQPKHDMQCEIGAYSCTITQSVDKSDLLRLKPGKWLNSALVDFKLWTLINKFNETFTGDSGDLTVLPSTVFFQWQRDKTIYKTTAHNPLSSKFIVSPLNINSNHWVLLFVAYASDVSSASADQPKKPRTAAIILDSLGYAPDSSLEESIRGMLTALGRGQVEPLLPNAIENMTFQYPTNVRTSSCSVGAMLICRRYSL